MKETFADTFYFLALLNPHDAAHARALVASNVLKGKLVTTDYVLVEVADAFARPADRSRFLSLLMLLQADPNAEVVAASPELLAKGVELYRNRADKDWPLTDCLSFVVMQERRIAEALTGDDHFRQAGYTTLL
jgi:predicted nucleic acid-binding protein